MKQIIEIYVNDSVYEIEWALSEYFDEIRGSKYKCSSVSAVDINSINNLSNVAKILLSAVSGAVIQYLIDINIDIDCIFENGYFIIR